MGCPERTIQQIILEDLEKLYREKQMEEPDEGFRLITGPERDAQERASGLRKVALFEEKAQTVKLLLGRELDLEARNIWAKESEAGTRPRSKSE